MSVPEETLSTTARLRTETGHLLSRLGLGFALVLVLVLFIAGLAGYQAGLSQRATQSYATQTAELQHQYELGVADLAAGRYEVAVERFTYILQRDPNYPGATEQLALAREGFHATATPAATASPQPSPSPTANNAAEVFARLQAAITAEDWGSAIAQAETLKALDPSYNMAQVNSWLFTALRTRGIERIVAKDMEAGIFDLDRAAEFGLLDSEALNYRAWARLYLAAQSYWGLDWARAVDILDQLYALAPYFHDTATKLYQARLNYAAQLMAQGLACEAAEQYELALTLNNDSTVVDSQATAQTACLTTPTPDPNATPSFDSTPEPTATP